VGGGGRGVGEEGREKGRVRVDRVVGGRLRDQGRAKISDGSSRRKKWQNPFSSDPKPFWRVCHLAGFGGGDWLPFSEEGRVSFFVFFTRGGGSFSRISLIEEWEGEFGGGGSP